MKMHPKPMARHTKHVEPVAITPHMAGYDSHPEPFHIQFRHAEGRTQLFTMTRDECLRLFTDLGAMLRFEDTKAVAIETGELSAFRSTMKDIVRVGVTFGRATGGRTREPVAWLRDIDGTGSLHPASKGDPGAFPVYEEIS